MKLDLILPFENLSFCCTKIYGIFLEADYEFKLRSELCSMLLIRRQSEVGFLELKQ